MHAATKVILAGASLAAALAPFGLGAQQVQGVVVFTTVETPVGAATVSLVDPQRDRRLS